MAASRVRVDYEEMARIALEFRRQAAQARRTLLQLRLQTAILQNGDWVGAGADKFYSEMESALLPAMGRLVTALENASGLTLRIVQIMRLAETEAARVLRDVAGGSLRMAAGVAEGAVGAAASAVVGGLQSMPGVGPLNDRVRNVLGEVQEAVGAGVGSVLGGLQGIGEDAGSSVSAIATDLQAALAGKEGQLGADGQVTFTDEAAAAVKDVAGLVWEDIKAHEGKQIQSDLEHLDKLRTSPLGKAIGGEIGALVGEYLEGYTMGTTGEGSGRHAGVTIGEAIGSDVDLAVSDTADAVVEAAGWTGENVVAPGVEAMVDAAEWTGENAVMPGAEAMVDAAGWTGENVVVPGAEAMVDAAEWTGEAVSHVPGESVENIYAGSEAAVTGIEQGAEVFIGGVDLGAEAAAGAATHGAEMLGETFGNRLIADIADFGAGAASSVILDTAESINDMVDFSAGAAIDALQLGRDLGTGAAASPESLASAAAQAMNTVKDAADDVADIIRNPFGR